MNRVILIFIMIFVCSCAPVRQNLGTPVDHHFADKLLTEWQSRSSQVMSVQGLANLTLRAPMNNVDGLQVVLAEMPNRLRAETLSPFGVPLMTFAVDDDRMTVLLPGQNLFYQGLASSENLGHFMNLPLKSSDLVSILLYQPVLIDAWKMEAFNLTDGGWVMVRHGTMQRQELVFGSDRELVEVSYFERNDLQFKASYERLSNDGIAFPNKVYLEFPKKYATLNLEFTEFAVNKPIKDGLFRLLPPEGAKVVHLPN